MTVSLVFAATAGVWLCLRTDWEHQVQKVRDRLASDKKIQADVEAHP